MVRAHSFCLAASLETVFLNLCGEDLTVQHVLFALWGVPGKVKQSVSRRDQSNCLEHLTRQASFEHLLPCIANDKTSQCFISELESMFAAGCSAWPVTGGVQVSGDETSNMTSRLTFFLLQLLLWLPQPWHQPGTRSWPSVPP